jgi:hypothetical protein
VDLDIYREIAKRIDTRHVVDLLNIVSGEAQKDYLFNKYLVNNAVIGKFCYQGTVNCYDCDLQKLFEKITTLNVLTEANFKDLVLYAVERIFEREVHLDKNKEPFYIEIKEIKCKNNLNHRCGNFKIYKYNLLEHFDEIEMEKYNGKFIPDLRLFNQNNNESIFIEIYYSSRISEKKINSNNRIIEIEVKNESDLKIIENKIFDEGNDNLRFYNFKRKYENNEKCNNCIITKNVKNISNIQYCEIDTYKYILLRKDGKIECKVRKPSDFELIKNLYRNIKIVDPTIDYTIQYKDFVQECKNKNMKIYDSW